MSEHLKRFRKRKELQQSKAHKVLPMEKAAPSSIEELLEEGCGEQWLLDLVNDTDPRIAILEKCDLTATEEEVMELLASIEGRWDSEKFDELIEACRTQVVASILGPFGLGRLVATGDRDGGPVTTTKNARAGYYARDEDTYERSGYTDSRNSNGEKFSGDGRDSVGAQFTRSQLDASGKVTDDYTLRKERGADTSPDHIESLHSFHKEGGFMLSSERRADFATDKENIALTRRDINQSLKDKDKKVWLDSKAAGREISNEEHYDVDRASMLNKRSAGKKVAQRHAPSGLDKTTYYVGRGVSTGISTGVKLGAQQALGLLLCEFFKAVFDEIKDIYKNGFKTGFESEGFLQVLKERLHRIKKRVVASLKNVLSAFKEGFVSGFLSTLVTVIINMFVRTGKRIVRIIREGFFSLCRAVKMLVSPPEGMSARQAAHEASKLVAAGLVVVAGVVVEQFIDASIKANPVLEPFADLLTVVLTGALTGVVTTFVIFALDKLDLFGAEARAKHVFIVHHLDAIMSSDEEGATTIDDLFALAGQFSS